MIRVLAVLLFLPATVGTPCGDSLPWDTRPWAEAVADPAAGRAPLMALLFQDGENAEIEELMADRIFRRAVEPCALVAAGRHLHRRPPDEKICPLIGTVSCEAHVRNWFPAYQTLAEDGTLTTPQIVLFEADGTVLARWKQTLDVGGEAGIGALIAGRVDSYREERARADLAAARTLLEKEDWAGAWKALERIEVLWSETEPASTARKQRARLERRRDIADVIRPLVRDREARLVWQQAEQEEARGRTGRARTLWKQLVRKYRDTTWGERAAARLEAEKKR